MYLTVDEWVFRFLQSASDCRCKGWPPEYEDSYLKAAADFAVGLVAE